MGRQRRWLLSVWLLAAASAVAVPLDTPPVSFQPGGRKPTTEGKAALQGIAKVLVGSTPIIIEVHTDFCDNDMELSAQRGEAIVAELVKLGMPRANITVLARGHRDALVPRSAPPSQRFANRRVVFRTDTDDKVTDKVAEVKPPDALPILEEPVPADDVAVGPQLPMLDEPIDKPSVVATTTDMADRPAIGLVDEEVLPQLASAQWSDRPIIGRLDDDRPAIGLLEDGPRDSYAPTIGLIE
jgi:hypothetical protein